MRRYRLWLIVGVLLFAIYAAYYIRSHPLIFNESFWEHEHCIKAAMLGLLNYADQNQGKFPYHPDGYGDALMLLEEDYFYSLTGPGYNEAPFIKAKKDKSHLPEEACGRVYVQGLSTTMVSGTTNVVLLFDKLPSPGDHCHLFYRIWAPLGREVGYADGHTEFIPETDWPAFAKQQIKRLVAEDIPRAEAERLYEIR